MIVDDFVEITWNYKNKSMFTKLGYEFTSYGDVVKIKISDLKRNSNYLVSCKCDFCGSFFKRQFNKVSKSKKHACLNSSCIRQLQKETLQRRYGVDSINKIDGVVEKRKSTFKSNYSSKAKRENLQKQKEDTRESTTGYRTPFHDPSIREKSKSTLIKKIGVDNPWKTTNKSTIHDRQVNATKTKSKNNSIMSSKQQRHLCEILNGRLNFPIDVFAVDVALDNNIAVEYNGGGHYARGNQQDIIDNDKKRAQVIFSLGWKLITIVSKKDMLFENSVMIDLIDKCCRYLLTSNDKEVVIDIDKSQIYSNSFLMKISYKTIKL